MGIPSRKFCRSQGLNSYPIGHRNFNHGMIFGQIAKAAVNYRLKHGAGKSFRSINHRETR